MSSFYTTVGAVRVNNIWRTVETDETTAQTNPQSVASLDDNIGRNQLH